MNISMYSLPEVWSANEELDKRILDQVFVSVECDVDEELSWKIDRIVEGRLWKYIFTYCKNSGSIKDIKELRKKIFFRKKILKLNFTL